jgi:hypothetical protein
VIVFEQQPDKAAAFGEAEKRRGYWSGGDKVMMRRGLGVFSGAAASGG